MTIYLQQKICVKSIKYCRSVIDDARRTPSSARPKADTTRRTVGPLAESGREPSLPA